MTKTQTAKIVILSVIITWLLNIFLGRFFVAKISTWPVLNRLNILSPQAPIVINNHETVRVSDSGDVAQAAGSIKSKISLLVWVANNSASVAGGAINLTSDGTFITSASAFGKTGGDYYVVLNDGRSAKVATNVLDPATSLMFFKANLSGVPTANLAASKDLSLGDKILFVNNSLQNFVDRASAGLVIFSQVDVQGQVFDSDLPRRSFGIQPDLGLLNGQVLANTNGDVEGIWNGTAIISSDVLKQAMDLYFGSGQTINRPSFGFSYSVITQAEGSVTGQSQGALVKQISGVEAKQAGLLLGDIITSVNGSAVSESSPLEQTLQNFKPGDQVLLTVLRKNQTINLTLTVGELKNGNN
jgi:serine protease DegQ